LRKSSAKLEKTESLLQTKFHKPVPSEKLVSRARLQTKITQSLQENPLTLVVAPAGFGKTTLLAASLADCKEKVAWLSLDREDNQIGRFLAYLIAALQRADNRIGGEAGLIIADMHQAVTEVLLTSLINDIDSLKQTIVLVLDDFQYISDQEVLLAVSFLIEHCPESFHLLVATRADPRLALSRLRARGQMLELRAADLRFNQDEVLQFLNGVMGIDLDERAAKILEERTEGWVAGLQMAAISMRDRDDIPAFIKGFSGTNRHILDFLLEEIMAGQPREIQYFLIYTSILERLTAPLCDALLADEPLNGPSEKAEKSQAAEPFDGRSADILNYLERENLFLVPLDETRTWFRYHHLFTDLLRARLQQIEPGAIPRLRTRACAWLEANGCLTEAIQQQLLAQQYDQAARLIEDYGPARLEKGDPTVIEMAEHLPQETLLSRPKIALYQVWFLIVRGNIRSVMPLLASLARQFTKVDFPSEQGWMKTVQETAQAFLAPPSSDPKGSPLPDEGLLDDIPAEELILRNAADVLYGMALARRGEYARALDLSARCIAREKAHQKTGTIPTLAPFLTRMYLITGQLQKCASLCHDYLDPIQQSGLQFVYTSGSMKIDMGEVLCEWGNLEEAEQFIRAGLKANEPWQNIMTDGFGLVALTRVLQARGDFSGALQAVARLETVLRTHALPREFEEDLHTLRVRVQLSSGDLQACTVWAEQTQQSADFILHKDRYRLTLARIYLAQGKYEETLNLLHGSVPSVSAGSRTSRQIDFNLLLAAALSGLQRQVEAFKLLDTSLTLAEPERYVQIFFEGGEAVRRLLTQYRQSDSTAHTAFVQNLLNAFKPFPEPGTVKPTSGGLLEPLSSRELEVLVLIAQGQTNQEIAKRLVVARGTIKAHAASIYRKLDVYNRTEAVNRARSLGILG